ncbi:MAG TPA: peroxiredoxin [Bacteroidales bacterium]|nr:peroxiredoxin [Bacteroidales bacterium]HBZ22297.1 peroxiredoxin [Bacteroidales bacterium]
MKKSLLIALVVFSVTQLWAQEKKEDMNFSIPLIGEKAPSFIAESTTGTLNFPSAYGRSWKILFSHPQDFTPVCSSEILELAHHQSEFDKLGVKLVVLSVDPVSTHKDWQKALEQLNFKDRGQVKIKFPLVDDNSLAVSRLYGMIHEKTNSTKGVRGVFFIDPDNTIQAFYFYPMNVGRSTEEIIRTVNALQTVAKDNVKTPSDWKAGGDVLLPYAPTPGDTKTPAATKDTYSVSWFMTYKKLTN